MLIKQIILVTVFSVVSSSIVANPKSESNADKQSQIHALLELAQDSFYSNREKSIIYASNALEIAKLEQDHLGIVRSLLQLGTYYHSKKKFTKSIDCFYEALAVAENNKFLKEKVAILEKIIYLYIELKKYNTALDLIVQAYALAVEISDYNQKAQLLLDQGRIYQETEQFNLAKRNYFYLLSFANSITEPRVIMNTYRGLGTVNFYEKDIPWAIYYFRLSAKECLREGLTRDLGSIYTLIAHVYQDQNNLDSCLKYNMLALDVRRQNDLKEHKGSSLVNIGNLYLARGQLAKAAKYINEGLQLIETSEDYNLISYAYRQLSRVRMKQKDYPEAIRAIERYYSAEDSLLNVKSKGEIEQIAANYWISEIEKEKNLLVKEVEIQHLQLKNKNYAEFILQLVLILVFLVVIFFYYLYAKSTIAEKRVQEINIRLDKEVQDRKQTEIQLRISEALYRFVTENTLDLIVKMDRKFNYNFVSPSIFRMFGYTPDYQDLPATKELIPEEFQTELRAQYLEMIRTKSPVTLIHQSRRKDGSLFWSESLVNPIFDEHTGKLNETITVIRDITHRVAYQESLEENARQKEVLLREIHHRVKNNFAILVSLMNMQKTSVNPGDFKEFLTELQGRIRTMSLVHELLYRSHDLDFINFGEYLDQLISIISRAYTSRKVTIHTNFDLCILDVETALPLGLISNEILTNAFKYALSDNADGELWIELSRVEEGANQDEGFTHSLAIRDNGPGLPEGFSMDDQSSMGSQIISLLIDQLEGRLELSDKGGASFTIYFSDEKRL